MPETRPRSRACLAPPCLAPPCLELTCLELNCVARHQTTWGAPQTIDAAERASRPLNLVRRPASAPETQKRKRRHPDIRMAPRGVCALSARFHDVIAVHAGQVSPSAWPVAAFDDVSGNRAQCCWHSSAACCSRWRPRSQAGRARTSSPHCSSTAGRGCPAICAQLRVWARKISATLNSSATSQP